MPLALMMTQLPSREFSALLSALSVMVTRPGKTSGLIPFFTSSIASLS